MDRVIISWNFRNWLTVVLMAGIGLALVGVVVSFLRTHIGTNNPISQTIAAAE